MLCIIQRILSVDFQISQFCTRGLVDTSCTGNEYHYMANPYDQSDLVLHKSSCRPTAGIQKQVDSTHGSLSHFLCGASLSLIRYS